MQQSIPQKLCGQDFGLDKLEKIRSVIAIANPPIREEIARRVCRSFNWIDSLGRTKLMSCKVALLRLDRLGLIQLPSPSTRNGNGKGLKVKEITIKKEKVELRVDKLQGLSLVCVSSKGDSELWNSLISKYHYLGYSPLAGAQKRYLIIWDKGILGAIGFSAAAFRLESRDNWIGWDDQLRERNLQYIVNNTRFLILPWVKSINLASKILSLSARRVREDFKNSYGYSPVLLETFVETGRFRGSSYRAANWIYLGQTKGRGKQDRYHRNRLPVKDIYVYPLCRDFLIVLGASR